MLTPAKRPKHEKKRPSVHELQAVEVKQAIIDGCFTRN
jgi:hypothetical protein